MLLINKLQLFFFYYPLFTTTKLNKDWS